MIGKLLMDCRPATGNSRDGQLPQLCSLTCLIYRPLQYAALTATSALFHLYCHAKGQEEEKTLANLVSSGIKILK